MTTKLTVISFVLGLSFGFAPSIALADFVDGEAVAKSKHDLGEVREWTTLAEKGNAIAQYNLGVFHYTGQGVTRDYKEAAKWFQLAADQGDAGAQANLGAMYTKGQGVVRDYKEAVKWLQRAADQGNALGLMNLGVMYANGTGVPGDYPEAAIGGRQQTRPKSRLPPCLW